MPTRAAVLATLSLLLPASAWAGRCDTWAAKAKTATGDDLVAAFDKLATCDVDLAKKSFTSFAAAAKNIETLVPLTLTAIDREVYTEVWEMMERVPYQFRGDLATDVGAACGDHEGVVTFLQGAYFGLKGTEFGAWQPALESCEADAMVTWLESTIQEPPKSPYNEKYDALLRTWVAKKGADGLAVLEAAAITAGKQQGPFNNVLDMMQRSIQPADYRSETDPADLENLGEALVRVAEAVPAEQARLVADRLDSAGLEGKAARLLPAIFPDRVQAGGEMLWAAAAIEQCEGDAIVHWVSWTEAPTRLDVSGAASGPLRATKGKLKCDAGEWPVRAHHEPFADADAAAKWVLDLVAELEGAGTKVKVREEKKVTID